MAKPAVDDPYIAISATASSSDDDDGFSDVNFEIEDGGDVGGPGAVAAQPKALGLVQDRREALARERSMRARLAAAAFLLMAVVLGGREYYVKSYGGDDVLAGGGSVDYGPNANGYGPNGVRGSPGDPAGADPVAGMGSDESFEGVDDGNGGGTVSDPVEGPGEWEVDVEYEGGSDDELADDDWLDDEIANEELEGDFDFEGESHGDGEGGEAAGGGETLETEGTGDGSGEEGERPPAAEGGELLGEDAEGWEDIIALVGDESTTVEEAENAEVLDEVLEDVHEEVIQEVHEEAHDETHVESWEQEGEPPDYFVPFTAEERERYKEKLRETLRDTRAALLFAATRGVEGAPMPQRTLALDADSPKQFMHMHHMKTGGTSVDGLISCALRRQANIHNGTRLNYNRMSECGSSVRRCMDTLAEKLDATVVDNVFYRNDGEGEAQADAQFSFDPADDAEENKDLNVCSTSEASVMSYCASLHAVRTFGWGGVDKITVIRDPVDRAWSMYRYSLNGCYECQELKDILRRVGRGTFAGRRGHGDGGPDPVYGPNDSCAVQMIGHQATNLLSSVGLYNVANDVRFPREAEVAAEAVRNLREGFTWIGLTDRLQESVEGFRTIFPFLAEDLNEAADDIEAMLAKGWDGGKGAGGHRAAEEIDAILAKGWDAGEGGPSLPRGPRDSQRCPFEHRNGGRAPTCGTKELDDETIKLIKRLSNRDVAVYKAAVERFELQQEVLAEDRAGAL